MGLSDKHVMTEIKRLLFDPENPRLPIAKRVSSESDILDYFIRKENLFDLISSIGQNGFYPTEALIVIPASTSSNPDYYVIEGNRRLAALKLINKPELAPIRKNTILDLLSDAKHKVIESVPVVICNNREEVLDYLGYRHITGVQEWDALAKARYLNQLYNYHKSDVENEDDIYKVIARIIGSRADYVRKLIRGYVLFNAIQDAGYFDINGLSEETISFSLLTTAVSYKNISDFLKLTDEGQNSKFDIDRLEEICKWIFEKGPENQKRVPDSRDLQTLNKVIENDSALKIFREGAPLSKARRYTDEPLEFFRKAIEDSLKLIDEADSQMYLVEKFDHSDEDKLRHITIKSRDLYNAVKSRISEENFEI